ncbi:MAG: biopolymer transporter ExbD [Pseudomonadota bacterium]
MFDIAMRRRRDRSKTVPPLNLNSMMDMLTIILVFLLCNISAEEQDFVLAENLKLPNSTSKLDFIKAVQVKLTKKELSVEDTFVAKVSKNELVGVKIDGTTIVPLYDLLKRYHTLGKSWDETTVVLQADKEFSFELLNKVLRTAAMAGYPNVRFATIKK